MNGQKQKGDKYGGSANSVSQLSGFKKNIIIAIADLEDDSHSPSGKKIRSAVESMMAQQIAGGHLYPQIDELVECGFVRKFKDAKDGRVRRYELTDYGRSAFEEYARTVWESV